MFVFVLCCIVLLCLCRVVLCFCIVLCCIVVEWRGVVLSLSFFGLVPVSPCLVLRYSCLFFLCLSIPGRFQCHRNRAKKPKVRGEATHVFSLGLGLWSGLGLGLSLGLGLGLGLGLSLGLGLRLGLGKRLGLGLGLGLWLGLGLVKSVSII